MSREQILSAIRQGKPELHPLPETIGFPSYIAPADVVDTFLKTVASNGGIGVRTPSLEAVRAQIASEYDLTLPTLSHVSGLDLSNFTPTDNLRLLDDLNLVVLQGLTAVAENACIWFDETALSIRALPFITLNVVAVVYEKDLVATMHEAYGRIDLDTGFGTFIAGPSKTADIEQSLVIGAHGSKTMTVFLLP
ncbi:LUD domain-containing protein [Spirosoma luteolum]